MKIENRVVKLWGPVFGACLSIGSVVYAFSSNVGSAAQVTATQVGSAIPLETPTDLKFGDFFKTPIGPKGLAPTEKSLALNGHRVRIVGYLAETDEPIANLSYLAPYPVALGHEDEPLADDLPATTVFIHTETLGKSIPHLGGLVRLTGWLAVGPLEESDGRISAVRLSLDRESLDSLSSAGVARRKGSEGPAIRERP